jgi:uncharacterized membrane protein YdbT with pleckstrin-like domain
MPRKGLFCLLVSIIMLYNENMDADHVTLTPGIFQTMGKKAFWLFVAEWLNFPTGLLIVAAVLVFARNTSFIPVELRTLVSASGLVLFIIALLGFIIAIISSRLVYKSRSFCLSEDAFKVRKGIFTKQEMAIPYRQIQNVEIERTLIQQLFGVSKLVIVTAGHDDEHTVQNESKGVLPTIDKELASVLQEELLKRADVQRIIQTTKHA